MLRSAALIGSLAALYLVLLASPGLSAVVDTCTNETVKNTFEAGGRCSK